MPGENQGIEKSFVLHKHFLRFLQIPREFDTNNLQTCYFVRYYATTNTSMDLYWTGSGIQCGNLRMFIKDSSHLVHSTQSEGKNGHPDHGIKCCMAWIDFFIKF